MLKIRNLYGMLIIPMLLTGCALNLTDHNDKINSTSVVTNGSVLKKESASDIENDAEETAPLHAQQDKESLSYQTYETEIGTADYIFPYSDQKVLTFEELNACTERQLRIGRNEIYARHGRRFYDQELQSEFTFKEWYEGTTPPEQFDESVLNAYEKANVEAIRNFEAQRTMVAEGTACVYGYRQSYDGVSTYQEAQGAGDTIEVYMPDINTIYVMYQGELGIEMKDKSGLALKFERDGLSFVNRTDLASTNRIVFGDTGLRLTQDSDDDTDIYREYAMQADLGNVQQGVKADWSEIDVVRFEALLMACGYCGEPSEKFDLMRYISGSDRDEDGNSALSFLIRVMLSYTGSEGKGKYPIITYDSINRFSCDAAELDQLTMDMFGIRMSDFQINEIQLNESGSRYEITRGDFGGDHPFAVIDSVSEDENGLIVVGRGGSTNGYRDGAEINFYRKLELRLSYNPEGYQSKYRIRDVISK